MIAILAGAALAADCAARTDLTTLEAHLGAAEAAFVELDAPGFATAADDAAFAVGCLGEVLPAAGAARVHRVAGLRQFVNRNDERAALSFAAARSIDDDPSALDALTPPGHVVRTLYTRFRVEDGRTEAVPPPRRGQLRFDGSPGEERPRSWPTVVQVLDADGRVLTTAYLLPGDPMPAYEMRPDRSPAPWVAGGALAAAALYGLAAVSSADARAEHPDWDDTDLRGAQLRTNGLVVASGVSAGFALVAVVIPW